jgi:hypothetical protein
MATFRGMLPPPGRSGNANRPATRSPDSRPTLDGRAPARTGWLSRVLGGYPGVWSCLAQLLAGRDRTSLEGHWRPRPRRQAPSGRSRLHRHDRRGILENPKDFETFIQMEFHLPVPPSGQYTYYPGTTEVPGRSAANVHGVSYKVLAEVEVTPDTQGVIFATAPASGDRAPEAVHRRPGGGRRRDPHGAGPLLAVRRGPVHRLRRRRPGEHQLPAPLRAHRGEIVKVVFDVADDAYVDVEAHLAMARD